MKREFETIDVFRFIAACLVVLLHAIETDDVIAKGIQYSITRCAVPFFFITSGFFFFRKISVEGYFKRYIKKVGLEFLFWEGIVYGPILIYDYLQKYSGQSWTYIGALIFRRMFVIGAGPYWYYVALIISTTILYICRKYINNDTFLLAFAVGGILLNIMYLNFPDSVMPITLFSHLIDFLYSGNNNFLLTGLPFTAIGALLGTNRKNTNNQSNLYIWMFILSTIGCIIEYALYVIRGYSFTISYIVQGISLFMIAIKKERLVESHLWFRGASVTIFLTHWMILYNILNPLLVKIGINPYYPLLIPFKWSMTILLSLLVFHVAKRYKIKWLLKALGIKA